MRPLSTLVQCAAALALLVCAASGAAGEGPAPNVRIIEPIDESRLVVLHGNTHPFARAKNDRGRVSADLPMGDLVLVLRRGAEQQAAADRFSAALHDPASPEYHRWLAPEEVGARFGPAQSDIDAVCNWLRSRGFSIDEITNDHLSIRFSGTAAQVEGAFHTEIHHLEAKGAIHIGNMADPRIPAALAPVVAGVKALHNFFPQPLHRLGSQAQFDRESGQWRRLPAAGSTSQGLTGVRVPAGVHTDFSSTDAYGNRIEDVAPYDFAKIYNVLPLWQAAKPIDGTGQKIAIAGTSNINPADVAAFRKAFGLPALAPTVVITNANPGNCQTGAAECLGGLVENTLDVEWSGAVAKGANIILVTSSAPTASTDALYLSESHIVNNKTASIMNVSYGECELALGDAGNTEYSNLWQTAAMEGIAVFVASGDAGSPACDQDQDELDGLPYAAQFGLAVNGLASTPFNTAVGGTDFNWGSAAATYWSAANSSTTTASALGYVPEVPWNNTCVNPLVLPPIEGDAAYLGVSGVEDAESACNFIAYNWSNILNNYGVDLAWLLDTVGGGGGPSNCTLSNQGYVSTCSGGYAKPAWQGNVPGIPADGKRDLPDVSFFASNGFLGSSYLICVSEGGNACTYSSSSEPTAQEVGGTSVASPAMAGVMALINQKAGGSEGSPNALLYSMAARQTWGNCKAESVKASSKCFFNDIDQGTNAMPCLNGSAYCNVLYDGDPAGILLGYNAGTGFDLATGLGSLNVANVVNNWPAATAPIVTLSPFSLAFPSTQQGASSAAQKITLTNTGKSSLSLGATGQGISITGANIKSFTQANTCGTNVAAGKSCTISVTFSPAVVGALSAQVSIADNGWQSPQTVSLSGPATAGQPAATISANSLGFGLTGIGSTNTAPAFTLTNTGHAALALTAIGITGTNPSSFSEANTCGKSLAVGASCAITVTFKPAASGALAAAVSFTDNAAGSPQKVTLSGAGTAVSLSATGVYFPGTTVGVASAAQTVTLTNKGSVALTLNGSGQGISISGTDASSFSQTNTCGVSVAAGGACSIKITFKPAAKGTLTAAVHVADAAYGSPQAISLSGTGQ
jgi:subtilase family serine protease